jgi:hypothetical protein
MSHITSEEEAVRGLAALLRGTELVGADRPVEDTIAVGARGFDEGDDPGKDDPATQAGWIERARAAMRSLDLAAATRLRELEAEIAIARSGREDLRDVIRRIHREANAKRGNAKPCACVYCEGSE